MKKIYSLIHLGALVVCLFLCSAVQLNAQCVATNIPYTEDFASAAPPSFPACTSMQNSGPGVSWVTYDFASGPTNGFTTKALAYFSDFSSIPNTWFYTKGLNLTAGTFYRLTYKYAANFSFYSENMKVSYGTSATASAMTATLTNHFHFSNDFVVTQTVDFTPATTGVYYIGFNACSDTYASSGIFVDDIAVNLSPSCVQLGTVNLASLTATNATINWPVGTPDGSWDVYYGPSPLTAPSASTAPTATTTTASYSLTGLTPSTAYDVYVRTYCSATDQSSWTSASSFTTPCVAVNTPYTQDFESALIPSVPACTPVQNLGSGNSWKTGTSVAAGFGSKALRYQFNDFNPADTWFYTQGLNLTGGVSYRLTYRYGNSGGPSYPERLNVNYGSSAIVSAMTHTLTNHFDFVNNYSITQTVDFIPATTGIYHIGFHAYSNATMKNIYVDDIMVDLSPTCFEPTSVNLIGLGATNASLNWTGGSASSSWDVYYGPSPLTAPTASTIPTATTTTASYTINGLSASTDYGVYVRAHCSATDQSFWVPANMFTTPCLPTSIPYTEDFESVTTPSVPACTSVEAIVAGSNWETDNNPGNGFTTNTLVYPYNNGTRDNWFYTRGLNLTAGTSYRLTYNYACDDYITPEDMNVSYGSYPLAAGMTGTLTNHYHFVNDYLVTKHVDFVPATTGIYYIGFHNYSNNNSDGIYVDDITVDLSPTCIEPAAVNLTSLGATNASLNWTGGSASASWDVYYGASPLTLPTATTVPTATTTTASYTINGLSANTAYNVYVRAHCSTTDQSLWVPVSFTTSCVPVTVLPFTEGFEGATIPNVPSCWKVIDGNNDGDQWNTQMSTTYAHTGTKVVRLYTDGYGGDNNDWLITPNIVLNGNQQLSYWVRVRESSEPNDYTVKLSTNGILTSAFTHTLLPLTTVSNDTYIQKIINLSAYSGSTVAIAFQVPPGGLDGYYIYLDDIKIEDVPVCNPPTALTFTNTTGTTTTLSWTVPSGATSANYMYEVRATGAAGSGTLGLVSSGTVAVPTNSVQVSGLAPSITYSAYVQSDCGSGDFSSWSSAQPLTTVPCMTLIAISSSSAICIGQSAVLTASASSTASYTWSANAGSATTMSVSVSPTVTTVYTLTAVSGTCTATSTVSIVVDCTVGMEELNAAGIKLMPNPNNGQVIISLPGTLSGNTILEVYDAIGKLVMKHPLSASDNVIITAPLGKGLYLYRIYNTNHVIKTGKMIRE